MLKSNLIEETLCLKLQEVKKFAEQVVFCTFLRTEGTFTNNMRTVSKGKWCEYFRDTSVVYLDQKTLICFDHISPFMCQNDAKMVKTRAKTCKIEK